MSEFSRIGCLGILISEGAAEHQGPEPVAGKIRYVSNTSRSNARIVVIEYGCN